MNKMGFSYSIILNNEVVAVYMVVGNGFDSEEYQPFLKMLLEQIKKDRKTKSKRY